MTGFSTPSPSAAEREAPAPPGAAPARRGLRSVFPETGAKRAAAIALVLLAFGWLALALFRDLDATPVHGDESWWMYFTRSFRHVVELDFSNPEWTDDLANDQPNLAKFVFGFSLWVTGKLDAVPQHPWEYSVDRAANAALGTVPRADVLRVGRYVGAAFALAAAAAAFAIACRLGGLPSGILVVAWLAANGIFVRCGRRAMPDSMFVFFVLLSVDLSIRFVERVRREEWRRAAWLVAAIGVAGFAATATKLNGAIAFVVFAAAALWAGLHRAIVRGRDRRAVAVALGAPAAAAALGFVLFALIHPLVLRNPVQGTLDMLRWRLRVIDEQRVDYPAKFLQGGEPTLGARLDLLQVRVLAGPRQTSNATTLGTIGPISLDFLFFLIGAASLGVAEALGWIRGRAPTPAATVLALVVLALAATLVWIGVDWDRYYLLAIPPVAIASAYLPGLGLRRLFRLPAPAP
jgi:dolichyl-phosphate-mannose-protein mannosyltransferase